MLRGEVWFVNLDPTIGTEINKTRPAIIVNEDIIGILPLKVIVPITDWKDRYAVRPWMVRIDPDSTNGLVKTSAIDTFQVRSVSEIRLTRKLGTLSESDMAMVSQALVVVFGLQ